MSTVVIAEAGVNHNGDLQKAFKLIDAASEAGADIVKFVRYEVGEGIEKEDEDFAAEVAAQLKN